MTPLEHALAYATRGWRVAPIAPATKWPRITAWQTAATTDPATIRAWWRPDDGVSIVTGAASRLVVVDVDPRHDGDNTLADLEQDPQLDREPIQQRNDLVGHRPLLASDLKRHLGGATGR